MAKLPAIQFYVGDWMKDPMLRSVSPAARGLWIDMLCLMHESPKRAYLMTPSGKPMTTHQLARMTGIDHADVVSLLAELEEVGVPSRTEDGVLYSRRMVRDEEWRQKRIAWGAAGAEHGIKGGRPRKNPLPHQEGVSEKPLTRFSQNPLSATEGVSEKPLHPFEKNPPSSSSSSSVLKRPTDLGTAYVAVQRARDSVTPQGRSAPSLRAEEKAKPEPRPQPTKEEFLEHAASIRFPSDRAKALWSELTSGQWALNGEPVYSWRALMNDRCIRWDKDGRPPYRPKLTADAKAKKAETDRAARRLKATLARL